MFHSIEEATAFIHERDIAMVDLKFSDLWGRWHHVTVPASQFNHRLMENGVGFDGSSVGFKTVSAGDMVMVPDLSTGFVDPFWELPTLSFICTTLEADTRNIFPYDPRNIARRAERYLRETGIADKSLWGPEFEFYVFDGVAYENRMNAAAYRVDSVEADWNSQEMGSGYTIPRHGGYHAIPPQDHLYNLRSKITVHLERMGVEVKYHHHEVGGPGQCEIETPLFPLMRAADAVFIIKYVTRMTAFELDMTATFMPKPLYGEAGSGMHFHQHIWKGDENLFYDAEGYGAFSDLGRYYIGGLLKHGAAVMAFTNPSTNSYRRLIPGYEAPISAIYSLANRSAAIRIPKYANQPHSARMEFRPPDATANPYLAMAAQLLAGIDGIRNHIDPTEMGFGPIDEDIFNWPAKKRAQIKALPTSLEEAMTALEADHDFLLAGDVFNMDLIERWIERKRQEDRQVRDRPHPYEIELYYDL
ncbi:MAG: type I glutamate--ammonia ligase [Anaerolineales bacterium]